MRGDIYRGHRRPGPHQQGDDLSPLAYQATSCRRGHRLRFRPVEAPDLGSFDNEIRWVLEHRLDDYRQPGTLRLVGSLVGTATSDPQLKVVFEEWIEQLSRAICQVIERDSARGDVRPEVNTSVLESLVAGIVAHTIILQMSFSPATASELAGLICQRSSRATEPESLRVVSAREDTN